MKTSCKILIVLLFLIIAVIAWHFHEKGEKLKRKGGQPAGSSNSAGQPAGSSNSAGQPAGSSNSEGQRTAMGSRRRDVQKYYPYGNGGLTYGDNPLSPEEISNYTKQLGNRSAFKFN